MQIKLIVTMVAILMAVMICFGSYDHITFHNEDIHINGNTNDGFSVSLDVELQVREKFSRWTPKKLEWNIISSCKQAIIKAIADTKIADIYHDNLWFQKKALRIMKKEVRSSNIKFINLRIKKIQYPESIFENTGNFKRSINVPLDKNKIKK
jgi:hypothetical protein